jgi:hypothetical protein
MRGTDDPLHGVPSGSDGADLGSALTARKFDRQNVRSCTGLDLRAAGVADPASITMAMRGPLLSGPVGSSAMLERVCNIAKQRAPAVVLSALWLAERLAGELPITVLVEADKRRGAKRAVRRARQEGRHLMVVAAGEELPVAVQGAGCVLLEGLSDIEDDREAADYLARLAPVLRPDGVVLALDATKKPSVEARVAALFMAASLTGIAQERPRDGAVLTIGGPAAAPVLAARLS